MLDARPAPPGFSARHDATSRAYRYRVLARRGRSAFLRGRALHWSRPLDVDALDGCAAALVGTHDFTAFTPTETHHARFEREIATARWERRGELLEFAIEADAFMRNMNRVLVGTMLEVASGRRTVAQFAGAARGRAALGRRQDRAAARPLPRRRRLRRPCCARARAGRRDGGGPSARWS